MQGAHLDYCTPVGFCGMADRESVLRREDQVLGSEARCNASAEQENGLTEGDSIQRPVQGELSPELQDMRDNAILNAQGHKAELERSFSPFAALGLGFRYAKLGDKDYLNRHPKFKG